MRITNKYYYRVRLIVTMLANELVNGDEGHMTTFVDCNDDRKMSTLIANTIKCIDRDNARK